MTKFFYSAISLNCLWVSTALYYFKFQKDCFHTCPWKWELVEWGSRMDKQPKIWKYKGHFYSLRTLTWVFISSQAIIIECKNGCVLPYNCTLHLWTRAQQQWVMSCCNIGLSCDMTSLHLPLWPTILPGNAGLGYI